MCLRFREMYINRGQNSTWNRQQVWRKNNLATRNADLLQNFAGMAMRKNAVGGKIVCRVHEVRFGARDLSGSADAAFGVGHNSAIEIDDARGDQRLKSQNDRGSITARIG